jgi:hypothetical protein
MIILAVALLGVSMYASNKVAKSVQTGDTVLGSKSGKGNSKPSNSNKPDKKTKPSDSGYMQGDNGPSGKPDKAKPVTPGAGSNSKKHRENIEEVVEVLTEVAEDEEEIGNTDVSDDLEEVAEEEEEIVDETAEAINEVEKQNKWKVMLFGTDYKNLGQLRSSLAHNTNAIRKLTRTAGSVETDEVAVTGSLETLLEERERIASIIQEQESQFSILGWVSRLLSGYIGGPIGSPGDDEVIDDAEDIIDAGSEPDGTMDSGTEPGDTTDSGTEPGDTVDSGTEPGDTTDSGTEPGDTVDSGTEPGDYSNIEGARVVRDEQGRVVEVYIP